MVLNLEQQVAQNIYDILSDYPEMKEALEDALDGEAKMRQGMCAMDGSWNGTLLPTAVFAAIQASYNWNYLSQRNLVNLVRDGQAYIELRVLAGALPDPVVMERFHFDMEAQAVKAGTTLDEVRSLLHRIVKGFADGEYGPEVQFHDTKETEDSFYILATVLGLGGMGDRGDGCLVGDGKLAVKNIKELMANDKIFNEKFDFLKKLGE